MPLPKRPHVASPEQVRVTRDGDDAIIEYADSKIATTHLKMGAKQLAAMTVGKPQVEYFEPGDQWVARGHALRCQIVTDAAVPVELDEPVVSIDGRDFTTAEFIKLLGGHGGWGMRIVFVPDDELHERPKIRVREPAARKKTRVARSRRG